MGVSLFLKVSNPRIWPQVTSGFSRSTERRRRLHFLETQVREAQPQLSPDGRYIAYVSNESGKDQIVVRTFPDSNQGQWPITVAGGIEPRWRRKDGRELYYLAPDGKVMVVAISGGPAFVPGAPMELFPAPPLFSDAGPLRNRYDVDDDGQRFIFAALFAASPNSSVSAPITAVINWPRVLDKKP